MHGEEPERTPALQSTSQPALQSTSQPALQPGAQPAPQGLDWREFWARIKSLIVSGKKLGGEIEATTQTPSDDVLLGKIGIITAKVATGRAGEIRLPVRGGTQDYIACVQAGQAATMEVNSPAEVVAFMPPNTVYVKPLLM